MFRSLTGTIGAALLGGAALLAPPQEQAPTQPAALARSAPAPGVVEQLCYSEYVSVVQTAGRDHSAGVIASAVAQQTATAWPSGPSVVLAPSASPSDRAGPMGGMQATPRLGFTARGRDDSTFALCVGEAF